MDTFNSNNTLMCYLNDVSEEISIESNKYRLTGITAYIEPSGLSGIGHYIAYVRRLSGQWEQHDDLTRT
ncbi:NOF-FB transposable element protein, partial [Aphis craccivora]